MTSRKILEKYQAAFIHIKEDPRYQEGIRWGQKRPGHPEGSVGAHIEELELNAAAIKSTLDPLHTLKLKIFIHTHDTFKFQARKGARISEPDSHASLARAFVEEYLGETDLSAILQHHDVLFSLWRAHQRHGHLDQGRMEQLISEVKDWDLFMTTKLVDNLTLGKDLKPTVWAVDLAEEHPRIELPPEVRSRMNKIIAERELG